MTKITISIPEELKELAYISKINWQLVVARKLKEELEELVKIKRIVSKSKLTEEQADELANEVNLSLADRYKSLSKRR